MFHTKTSRVYYSAACVRCKRSFVPCRFFLRHSPCYLYRVSWVRRSHARARYATPVTSVIPFPFPLRPPSRLILFDHDRPRFSLPQCATSPLLAVSLPQRPVVRVCAMAHGLSCRCWLGRSCCRAPSCAFVHSTPTAWHWCVVACDMLQFSGYASPSSRCRAHRPLLLPGLNAPEFAQVDTR